MNTNYQKIKRLFLAQSYQDSWEEYQKSLRKQSYIVWDYVILTASNEEQAEAYRQQITYRRELETLPCRTNYVVLSDPDGKRVGSGGATFNVMKYIAEQDGSDDIDHFSEKRILVIHSGGDSKRVPQYSACGKLFSPVPRELPNGRPSTLFDEVIIGMTAVAPRIPEGMLVLSGDVLLLFNPLQIDFQYHGAAAISIKEDVETGKDHGVYLNDGRDHVDRFLHKQSKESLCAMGAVNENNAVDLDTGAVVMDADLLNALFGLISTNNRIDTDKFDEFVNEQARISFYGDFLYPLANKSTLEEYYKESPEGSFCEELTACRTKIWNALHEFEMKLLCLSPAEFIHFGTTSELCSLVTSGVDDYEYLGWHRLVKTNVKDSDSWAVNNSLLDDSVRVGNDAYIEDCKIGKKVQIGKSSVISNLEIEDMIVPADVVLHGLKLKQDKYVTRIYSVLDNPKELLEEDVSFLGSTLHKFIIFNNLTPKEIWDDEEHYLWYANLYPVCSSQKDSVSWALLIKRMSDGVASKKEIDSWKVQKRLSLYSSFNMADVQAIVPWRRKLENTVTVERFVDHIRQSVCYKDAVSDFGEAGMHEEHYQLLMSRAAKSDFSTKIRIYYGLARCMKRNHLVFDGKRYDFIEELCFGTIRNAIYENGKEKIPSFYHFKIAKDEVNVELPVRVNWGGGWTDTPPYCNENGGVVLNAAISLNGINPIQVTIKRIPQLHIEFESADIGVKGKADTVAEIQDCHNPYDFFSLHKAALIACGIIPIEEEADLQEILKSLGGGFYLSTQVVGVPKGSGLGTSSILSGACVKAIFEFLGQKISDNDLYDIVLCMEQIMSTGGGWQDQVGGVTPGIKFISSKPGINQKIEVEKVELETAVMKEMEERFALIYTGQRRLARNLLRDVVGDYIGNRKESLAALSEMEKVAVLMKFELQRGDIDAFAELLNQHWKLSKKLDGESTNTCIDQIFLSIEDLIDGQFISGAGGGGFLQVIMKKGVTRKMLSTRLHEVFQDSGVEVWETKFV